MARDKWDAQETKQNRFGSRKCDEELDVERSKVSNLQTELLVIWVSRSILCLPLPMHEVYTQYWVCYSVSTEPHLQPLCSEEFICPLFCNWPCSCAVLEYFVT